MVLISSHSLQSRPPALLRLVTQGPVQVESRGQRLTRRADECAFRNEPRQHTMAPRGQPMLFMRLRDTA